jgi:ribosomal protein L37AE/L43A
MTDIERLWDGALTDEESKRIRIALEDKDLRLVIICESCGSESKLDKISGCYNCTGCGQKVCGDS